ncbi:hypothetical protein [Levilactobacillus sp. N40-8-2]|uniref:hypothetical protein n=1 Tax=Levilactobacillus muriae TaxID=3238987 RepID=UPI0038B3BCF0
MLKRPRRGDHSGWLLPDALLALGIVALTIGLAQQTLTVTQYGERVRTAQLRQARERHDQALLTWAADQ